MIPSLEGVIRMQKELAARLDLDSGYDPVRITEALREAAELAAGREDDVPAALIFAFARHPRALRALWKYVPLQLAKNRAFPLGLRLDCDPNDVELEILQLRIKAGHVAFKDVQVWVAAHMRPVRPGR